MKNENILNEMKELKNCLDDEVLNMFSEAVDYNGCMYICDVISEVIDSNINIYYDNLFDWCKGNYSYVEDAINELGTPPNKKGNADFMKMIQQGQYYYYEQLFYDNLDAFVKYYTLKYLIDNKINVDDEKLERLLDVDSTDIDNIDYLEDIEDYIKEFLKDKESE